MKFSIIVPIYNIPYFNGSNLLERCIDSIINQSYNNIEILLIDDGSTDNTTAFCENLAGKDRRVVFIRQENQGQGEARNTGIRNASGDWLIFIDSDDFINIDSCETIYSILCKFKNLDVLQVGYEKIDDKSIKISNDRSLCLNSIVRGVEYLSHNIRNGVWFIEPWKRVYNTSFLRDHNLYFEKGQMIEDVEWTLKVLIQANAIYSTQFVHYYHFARLGSESISLSSDRRLKRYAELSTLLHNLSEQFENLCNEELKYLLMDFLVSIYMYQFLDNYKLLNKNDYINIKLFSRNKAISKSNRIRNLLLQINPTLFYFSHKLYSSVLKAVKYRYRKCYNTKTTTN